LSTGKKLGITTNHFDRFVGIYGFFTGNYDSDAPYTLVEAVEDGWWYSAPLPGSSRVVAFMTDADLCSRLLMRNVSHWEAQLDRAPHTKAEVARLQFSGRLDLLAANSSHLDRVCGRNWLAIGDAASSFDPLSGAGVLRALQSGMKAAEVIFSWLSGKESGSQEYSFACEQEFRDYLRQGHRYYQREQRWTSAPFWARRHSANFALAPASGLTEK
jgi:flavin-dependent dehydrogenase